MLLRQIITAYEAKVPLEYALPNDNNGLKLGSMDKDITKILGCLELTVEVADYAIKNNIDCLFVHHNPFYVPLSSLRADDAHAKTLSMLLEHDIALYVSHTNLDVVPNGLNDYIYTLLGGEDAKTLEQHTGIGRFGAINAPLPLDQYIQTFVQPIQSKFRVITNNQSATISSIAVVNGSGAGYLTQASAAGVDLFITGDVDYHTAMQAREYDIHMLDIGHDIEYLVYHVFSQILNDIKTEQHGDFTVVEAAEFNFTPW